jgi:hypothetical protein
MTGCARSGFRLRAHARKAAQLGMNGVGRVPSTRCARSGFRLRAHARKAAQLGMKGDGQLIGRLIKVRRLPAMQDHHLRDSVEDQEA